MGGGRDRDRDHEREDHRWWRRWIDRERKPEPRGMEIGLDAGHYSGTTPGRRCSLRRLDAWRSSRNRWSYQRSHFIFLFNRVHFLWLASCSCIICCSCFFFSLLGSRIPHLLKFLFLFLFRPPPIRSISLLSVSSAHLYFLFFVFFL